MVASIFYSFAPLGKTFFAFFGIARFYTEAAVNFVANLYQTIFEYKSLIETRDLSGKYYEQERQEVIAWAKVEDKAIWGQQTFWGSIDFYQTDLDKFHLTMPGTYAK